MMHFNLRKICRNTFCSEIPRVSPVFDQIIEYLVFSLHGICYTISIFPCFRCLFGGSRVVVSTAAFRARVRGSRSRRFERSKNVSSPSTRKSIVESLCDREVACSAPGRQCSNFEFCVWRAMSSHSSHHTQEVLLAQFNLYYVHKVGLKSHSFFLFLSVGAQCRLTCQ